MLKSILRVLTLVSLTLVSMLALAYYYFLYTPKVDPPPLAGLVYEFDIEVDDIERRFQAYVPTNLQVGAPLVFVLHGSLRRGDSMRATTAYRFDELADQHGFIAVYPNGVERHWNDCRGSADYAANLRDINDPEFFSKMIEFASINWRVNTDAVFLTGISNGGQMAYRLAMERPAQYRAIAPVAANLPVAANRDCGSLDQAISVAMFNGTKDPVNPYAGGLVSLFGNVSRGEVLSSAQTMQYWLDLANVDAGTVTKIDHPERDNNAATSVVEHRWSNAQDNQHFRLYQLIGSGHVFPLLDQRLPRILGPGAGDISGADEIIDFFYSTLPTQTP